MCLTEKKQNHDAFTLPTIHEWSDAQIVIKDQNKDSRVPQLTCIWITHFQEQVGLGTRTDKMVDDKENENDDEQIVSKKRVAQSRTD